MVHYYGGVFVTSTFKTPVVLNLFWKYWNMFAFPFIRGTAIPQLMEILKLNPAMAQVMACLLFDAKPLCDPAIAYYYLDTWEQISVKCGSKYDNLQTKKRLFCLGFFVFNRGRWMPSAIKRWFSGMSGIVSYCIYRHMDLDKPEALNKAHFTYFTVFTPNGLNHGYVWAKMLPWRNTHDIPDHEVVKHALFPLYLWCRGHAWKMLITGYSRVLFINGFR